jgi:hypothetical protein
MPLRRSARVTASRPRDDGVLPPFAVEVGADLRTGPGRDGELQPVAGRAGVLGLGGQHLDRVAVGELVVERDEAAVDPGADAAVADLGVDRVREVDRGRPGRQPDDLPLRGEDEHLVLVEVDLERLEVVARLGDLLLPLEQLLDPGQLVGPLAVGPGPRRVLVLPVGGDPELGGLVHRAGADLDLERAALRPDHRGVQRLVEVHLRHRDVVLEPPGDRTPGRVQLAEDRVAVTDRGHDDADRDEVVDLVELLAAQDHLLVDRVVVLRAAGDLAADLQLAQLVVDRGHDLLEVGLPFGVAFLHHRHDLLVALGVEGLEAEVLEPQLELLHPEAVRQRRVDVERLLRDPLLLLARHVLDRLHVVETIGELDDQDPDVLRHREDHLAQGLGLLLLLGLDLDPVELGDPVDEVGDLLTEPLADVLEGGGGVLDRVVQQRGDHRGGPEAERAELGRDRDRVGDVGLTGLAALALVHHLGVAVGAHDLADVEASGVAADGRGQALELGRDDVALDEREAGEDPHDPRGARGGGTGRAVAALLRPGVLRQLGLLEVLDSM